MTPEQRRIEKEWVMRAQQGDSNAFGLLVGRYQSKVIAQAYRWTKNPEDAEEIAQEAFIKAWDAIGKFRGDSAFYTWLYRIVHNAAYAWNKKHSTRPISLTHEGEEPGSGLVMEVVSEDLNPEQLTEREQLLQQLNDALKRLPEEQQEAYTLCELEQMSYEEIAASTGVPIGTVRSRIFRARRALAEELKHWRQERF
ncbi:MAG: sigma-70 family RNA polymerase sigma factor [Gammaproteobacteria bacterium AqS3]|nr:sigma-70 family RNA polymerase sigma factor [Gammaproteobacteria bacterium AqS3]